MKIQTILGICLFSLLFTSCGKKAYLAEDLMIPVIHAVQDNDYEDLTCLQPSTDNVNEIYSGNLNNLGPNYYNKYTRSYRQLNMRTALHNDLEIINGVSEKNGLDWDDVQLGGVNKEAISDDGVSYTRVTANIRFPKGGNHQLSYNTIQHHGLWYLLDDVSLTKSK